MSHKQYVLSRDLNIQSGAGWSNLSLFLGRKKVLSSAVKSK